MSRITDLLNPFKAKEPEIDPFYYPDNYQTPLPAQHRPHLERQVIELMTKNHSMPAHVRRKNWGFDEVFTSFANLDDREKYKLRMRAEAYQLNQFMFDPDFNGIHNIENEEARNYLDSEMALVNEELALSRARHGNFTDKMTSAVTISQTTQENRQQTPQKPKGFLGKLGASVGLG